MSTQDLILRLESAPNHVKREVLHFLEFLLSKEKHPDNSKKTKSLRKAGFAKGIITHIADDFDEPLDDLKEYME